LFLFSAGLLGRTSSKKGQKAGGGSFKAGDEQQEKGRESGKEMVRNPKIDANIGGMPANTSLHTTLKII
jgi:hypothetical protein